VGGIPESKKGPEKKKKAARGGVSERGGGHGIKCRSGAGGEGRGGEKPREKRGQQMPQPGSNGPILLTEPRGSRAAVKARGGEKLKRTHQN